MEKGMGWQPVDRKTHNRSGRMMAGFWAAPPKGEQSLERQGQAEAQMGTAHVHCVCAAKSGI